MSKNTFTPYLILILSLLSMAPASAEMVELHGKLKLESGSMPATAIVHSCADETYVESAIIDKEGNFSFKVNVTRATLFNIRIMRSYYDVMLSTSEKTVTFTATMYNDMMKDVAIPNSKENEAYITFRPVINMYDARLITHFKDCDNADTCEAALHSILTEYAHELSLIQDNFKGTYTADVLCKMKMPAIASNVKNTTAEYRKRFFDNVDFSDSTIFSTDVYKEMLTGYIDYIVEAVSLTREREFVNYITDKFKSNPKVLHRSAPIMFDELFRAQREKMMAMYLEWYYTGTNKAAVNSPVMESKARNISLVMPGQPYINVVCPDSSGSLRSLKQTVDGSKCTLLVFWSSECSHCREEMPLIKEYYEKYHSKGFDVFAVSIEPDAAKWKAFLREKMLPWTNVLSSRMMDPNPAMQYVSLSTPTLVLIDRKGTIIHRFMNKTKVEKYIIDALK